MSDPVRRNACAISPKYGEIGRRLKAFLPVVAGAMLGLYMAAPACVFDVIGSDRIEQSHSGANGKNTRRHSASRLVENTVGAGFASRKGALEGKAIVRVPSGKKANFKKADSMFEVKYRW